MSANKKTKGNSGKASGKTGRDTFFDRVRLLANTTLRLSSDTQERKEALTVIELMDSEKSKAA